MMESAEDGLCNDLTKPVDWARNRRILSQSEMRPNIIVVGSISLENLTQMGLASKADVSATKLSQVELRKMELARAMATHPKLLISDEAMAGLSSSEVDEVLDLLISLADQDITIIMIEHIMQAVMRFSQRMMCLETGRIIAIGTPAEVMANQRVQEAYLGT